MHVHSDQGYSATGGGEGGVEPQCRHLLSPKLNGIYGPILSPSLVTSPPEEFASHQADPPTARDTLWNSQTVDINLGVFVTERLLLEVAIKGNHKGNQKENHSLWGSSKTDTQECWFMILSVLLLFLSLERGSLGITESASQLNSLQALVAKVIRRRCFLILPPADCIYII